MAYKKLTDYQKEFLYCEKRFTLVEASTKSGKTASHILWLFELSIGKNKQWYYHSVKEGWEFWWVAPIYPQAEIAFNRLRRKIQGKPGFTINKSKLFIVTPFQTIIRFKSADKPDSLYGEDVYAVVFDEFTRAKEDAWFAIRSTLTATNGPCKFIGNYTGASNWGHKLIKKTQDPDSNWAYFKVNAWQAVEAGVLKREEIEEAREDLPETVFKALYLAEGSIDEDVIYDLDALEDMYTNTFIERGNFRCMTADIALHGADQFVVRVWYGWRVVETIVREKIEPDEVTRLIKSTAEKHKIPRSRIVYDADGLGTYLRGYLRGARPFTGGSRALKPPQKKGKKDPPENYENLRAQCYFRYAKRVNNREVYIENSKYKEECIQELENTKKAPVTSSGKLKIIPKDAIKKLLKRSPDFADSLMMREYLELITPKGGGTGAITI